MASILALTRNGHQWNISLLRALAGVLRQVFLLVPDETLLGTGTTRVLNRRYAKRHVTGGGGM